MEAAVLDLTADDGGGMQKQKSSYHWDKVWSFDYIQVQYKYIYYLPSLSLCPSLENFVDVFGDRGVRNTSN